MEGLWVIFLIIGLVSKIMGKNKKSSDSDTSKPKVPKTDLDVSAKKFLEQMTENIEALAREKDRIIDHTPVPTLDQQIPVTLVEGECIQDVHLEFSAEGKGLEGMPSESEGISTEGALGKGDMAYQDTRSIMMEGSAHPLAAEVDFRATEKMDTPQNKAGSYSSKQSSSSVWVSRIIWKEILSEPVALRKRHG